MSGLEQRIRDVVKRRLPRGWRLIEHAGADMHGSAHSRREIRCPALADRDALCVFLHEVGHVVLGHMDDPTIPDWQIEYEAEQWALTAMRSEGFRVTERYRGQAREYVRRCIDAHLSQYPDAEIDAHVLKYAYPDSWRKILYGESNLKEAA